MAKTEVIQASYDHVAHIAENMRLADKKEIWHSHRSTPRQSLCRGVKESTQAWTVLVDDAPCLMFGVAQRSLMFNTGTPWLLGTDDIEKIGLRFIRHSRSYVDKMLEHHSHLSNAVHVDNEISVKWLLWMGFELKPAVPVGIDMALFYPFELRANHV